MKKIGKGEKIKNLNNLLKNDNQIIFVLNDTNRCDFLIYAKNNDCKWFNGEEIEPEKDNCSFHIIVKNDLTIGNLSTQCLLSDYKNCKRYNF